MNQTATPSQAEFAFREAQAKKESVKSARRKELVEKYGGNQHLDQQPKELLITQSEAYVEYASDGKVLRGQDAATKKSKYEEDGMKIVSRLRGILHA